ncbi:MAG: GntR family transcriptional regulator [Clostridia bacterium]|nr:GntR family transcriptional regulator [Clostridia bacterium]
MAWKFQSGRAISEQIADRLRSDIISGRYKMGEQFPTVRSLAEEAGVNPNTVQKSLTLLENEGLIRAQSTVGRVVTDDGEAINAAGRRILESRLSGFVSEMKELGISKDELIDYIRKGWDSNV